MNARDLAGVPAEPFEADAGAERRRLLADLARAYRLFGTLRWGELGDGHITCRDPLRPDHMWLLRYGVSFERATVDDLVLVAPDGNAADRDGRPAPINASAFYIHHPLHEARPDIGAAAHTHTQWGTPFSAERRMIEPINQEATCFFEDHVLFDDEEVQILSTDGGKRIATALGDCRAAVLANHGLLTVGASPADAVGWFVLAERVAEVQMKAPAAVPISAPAARIARDDLTRGDFGWNLFGWATRRHLSCELD
ncbi:class II aldolase/adducin family protein [Candidatus Poriferisodalis sp.]|uniref:class II aldolase/adducin family protein n=1 Tax=Candidatus Poriferisodalis sp. TaxID=3101277 RepID=UPI003B0129AE